MNDEAINNLNYDIRVMLILCLNFKEFLKIKFKRKRHRQ